MPARERKSEKQGAAERTLRLLGESSAEAVGVLLALMRDSEQKPELRMKAAESILDRVCGKAGSHAPAGEESGTLSVRFEGVLEEWSQ